LDVGNAAEKMRFLLLVALDIDALLIDERRELNLTAGVGKHIGMHWNLPLLHQIC
jgi:hypothetical protein